MFQRQRSLILVNEETYSHGQRLVVTEKRIIPLLTEGSYVFWTTETNEHAAKPLGKLKPPLRRMR